MEVENMDEREGLLFTPSNNEEEKMLLEAGLNANVFAFTLFDEGKVKLKIWKK